MDNKTKNMLRVGKVCDLDEAGQRVRVNFDDLKTVSPWIDVPTFGAKGDDYYWMPEIDEQVLCAFMPTGNAEGYVLRSIRGAENAPKAGDANKRYIRFSDGGLLEYDKGSNTLTIEAKNIVIKGDMAIDGKMTSTGGIVSDGDVVAGGISLEGHVHDGVVSGGRNTGGPR